MRGSYSTPDVPDSSATPTTPCDGKFTFEWTDYDDQLAVTIDPATFDTPVLAGELAVTWLQVLTEFGRNERSLTTGLLDLLRSIGLLPLTDDAKSKFAVRDLRRSHLDLWELNMLARHREAKSDTAYRKVVHVFALLRRHEDDHPGSLHKEVADRLARQPRLWHHRNDGLPPLSPEEIRAWRRWAYQKAKSALTQPGRGITDIDVQTATHVLLSLATGEPPEVLRALTIHDIEATATTEVEDSLAALSPVDRLAYLAENDLIELLRVRYTKNRAHETYDEVYGRRDTAPFTAFRWALMLNAAARSESGHLPLILMKDTRGTVRQPPWQRAIYRLSEIAERNGLPLSGPNHWARLRKVATTREVLADPRAYLANGRRHSAKTFFGHYTNSSVLRAKAGRILIDSVNDMFDSAVNGPTIVTPDAEQAIRAGADAPGLDPDTASALVAGQLDGPHTGCRDPLDSPYEKKGTVCTKSITGTCFACPNALITLHHLPAALAIQDMTHPDRAADPRTWQTHWKPIYDTITEVVLPAFSPDQIQRARQQANLTPIDAGVLNDMRGVPEAPAS
ncbi:hypothetical protein [Mycobacterium vicinigordonae]|uniref:hypothetical protein n=1 Tax=Mycobacterium vicinigordonae TaxID=1719132 RepID=UPI001FE2F44B|nr:hypothetical protein [Mycobacterium vicinigordonae]